VPSHFLSLQALDKADIKLYGFFTAIFFFLAVFFSRKFNFTAWVTFTPELGTTKLPL